MSSSAADPETPEWYVPNVPALSDEQWDELEVSGNFCPLFFEWFKWAGILASTTASIRPDSEDFRDIPNLEYYVLSSLLIRCARLMKSIVALTHSAENGESASIIERSVEESALKIMWLCKKNTNERTRRLVADGLKVELEFEDMIKANIEDNSGEALALEERMLQSMENHISAAGLSREEIKSSKRMVDMYSIHDDVNLEEDEPSRLSYVVQQRLGSHAVHGNWPSLLRDYLEESDIDGYEFEPGVGPTAFHVNQYMSGARWTIKAMRAYVNHCLAPPSKEHFVGMFEAALEELIEHYRFAVKRGL